MVRKYCIARLFLIFSCAMRLSFASDEQEGSEVFTAANIRAAFDRDVDVLQASQRKGVAQSIPIAEQVVRVAVPLSGAAIMLSELIASQESSEKISNTVSLNPFFVKTIDSQIIIPKKFGNKKRLLKQSKKFLIDPVLDQVALYQQAYLQGISDGQILIEKYADVTLKDELPLIHKDVYEQSLQQANLTHENRQQEMQKNHRQELESKNFFHNAEKHENYKKGLRTGLLIGTLTAGFAVSAGLYVYHQQEA